MTRRGDAFHGKHRPARVQRWQAQNVTAKAKAQKKKRRKAQRAGRRAARKGP